MKLDKDIKKLCQLVAENQQLKSYLHHIEERNNLLKDYINKIESSKVYNILKKAKLILKKVKHQYNNRRLTYELSKLGGEKTNNLFDVIIFASIKYDFRYQRPQHLAFELTKRGHKIFYIEPDFIPISSENPTTIPLIEKIKPNLYKVKLISNSMSTKKMFVYYGIIEPKDQSILVNSVKNLLQKANISKAVIKVDNPSWTFIVDKINLPIIYDCIDDHGAFETNPENIESSEKNLIKKSSAVVIVSRGIAKKINKYRHPNSYIIENAGEYDHFAKASERNISVPKDLISINKPILGYCGAISEWFDVKLLEEIAKTFPSYAIVLIGNPDNPKVVELTQKYQNIHLLGEKNYQLLPGYYQRFNVCLIPFVINEVTKTLNPVKIYEYLATGKPVVTTNIPGLNQFNDFIYMSKDSEQFIQNIKKALSERDQQLFLKRQQFSKDNTWEKRAIQLESVMKQVLEHNL